MPLSLVFMGTPEFSVATLDAILRAGHKVVAVYSQPARRAGRGMAETKSPVHQFAEAAGIPVLTPKSLKGEAEQQAFAAHKADAAVVVAYGLLLPKAVFAAPRHGCFNVHASALPRWRGAAPIQRAIMAGDRETAVMVMRMEEGLDTGPVCATERESPSARTRRPASCTTNSLSPAPRSWSARWPNSNAARSPPRRSPAKASPTPPKSTRRRHNSISRGPPRRCTTTSAGYRPFRAPGSRPRRRVAAAERIKVLRSTVAKGHGAPGEVLDDRLTIACGTGAVRLVEVQRAGKRPASAEEFLRGFALAKGTLLPGR